LGNGVATCKFHLVAFIFKIMFTKIITIIKQGRFQDNTKELLRYKVYLPIRHMLNIAIDRYHHIDTEGIVWATGCIYTDL